MKQAETQRPAARYALIVEDDKLLAAQMAATLRNAGLAVKTAASGQSALDVIDQAVPSVMVLDVFLPGANGWQLLAELRSHADTINLPVVICSSCSRIYQENSGDSLSKHWGVVQVIDKADLTPSTLLQAVKKAAGQDATLA